MTDSGQSVSLTCRSLSEGEADPIIEQMGECVERWGEFYLLYADGQPVGVTDEYGTCHSAADGWTKQAVEDLILHADGSWRDVEIGAAQ